LLEDRGRLVAGRVSRGEPLTKVLDVRLQILEILLDVHLAAWTTHDRSLHLPIQLVLESVAAVVDGLEDFLDVLVAEALAALCRQSDDGGSHHEGHARNAGQRAALGHAGLLTLSKHCRTAGLRHELLHRGTAGSLLGGREIPIPRGTVHSSPSGAFQFAEMIGANAIAYPLPKL
jgi:hypothetical protein